METGAKEIVILVRTVSYMFGEAQLLKNYKITCTE